MNVYKIKHIPSGKFYKGGTVDVWHSDTKDSILNDKFSKNGKFWNQINHVTCALSQHDDSILRTILRDECELVTYELIITEEIKLKEIII